jgi:hypothetical protein
MIHPTLIEHQNSSNGFQTQADSLSAVNNTTHSQNQSMAIVENHILQEGSQDTSDARFKVVAYDYNSSVSPISQIHFLIRHFKMLIVSKIEARKL